MELLSPVLDSVLSHSDTHGIEQDFGENRGTRKRGSEYGTERKIGCLAEERTENCGYTLQEPLKGRLPARTIDYRNASHTQSRSGNKSNLAKKR